MRKVDIGVVCEGKDDHAILKYCIGNALKKIDFDATFHALQPPYDQTSGNYETGGWREVYRWCLLNDPNYRQRLFGQSLFKNSELPPLDILAIQIDGDIFNILTKDNTWKTVEAANPDKFQKSTQGIYDYCIETTEKWLKKQPGEPCVSAPTIMSSEAWMLAAVAKSKKAESLASPKTDWAKYWLKKNGRPIPDGIKKLDKRYGALAKEIAENQPDLKNLQKTVMSFDLTLEHVKKQLA